MVDDFVSIVLPVRDGEKTLARCLEALVRTDYPADRREIVVVDNVSSDRTPEIARSFPVTLVSELREGLSHARNRGVEVSVGELIVFLDVDCFVTTNWLRKLVDCLRSAPVDAVTGEVIAFPPSTPAQKYFARRKPLWQRWIRCNGDRSWFLFSNAIIRRRAFETVGGFDPSFTGVGAEDIDFCWRFYEAGLAHSHCAGAVVFHQHRETTRELFTQQMRNGRGQARLIAKHPESFSWGARAELGAWRDLMRSAWHAGSIYVKDTEDPGRLEQAGYPDMDFVRKLGQRIGFMAERLTSIRAR